MLKLSVAPLETVLKSPVFWTIGIDQQVHTLPICEFEGFVGGLGSPNFDIGESHQLIPPVLVPKSIEPGIPSVIPSSVGICSRNWVDAYRLRKARNLPNLLFLWTKVDVSRLAKSFVWCRRPDSNRHVFLRLILNQLRVPISPRRHWRAMRKTLWIIPGARHHASASLLPLR